MLPRPALILTAALAAATTAATAQTATQTATQTTAQTAGTKAAGSTDVAGQPATAPGTSATTASGLVFQLMKAGQGERPQATDLVRVHYRGTFLDGREFDSSHKRGKPAEFPLNRVIPCWTEGLQLMQVGATARLTCPPTIAYGARGAGNVIPPNATLRFDVELLGIAGGR